MKKLALIFMLLMSMTFVYSQQTDSTKYVTNSQTEKLVDKYLEKVEAGIAALAQKLEQPAEFVWKILVRQQLVKGVCISLSFVLSTIIFIIFFRISWINSKRKNYDSEDDPFMFLAILFGVMSLILCIIFLVCGLPLLLNPEYTAIKDIFDMIGNI